MALLQLIKFLKRHNQANIIKKSVILFWLLRGRIKHWGHANPQDWQVKETAIPEWKLSFLKMAFV